MVITYPGLKILIKNEVLYMKELLNKKLTYGQLTRGVLNEEPKKGNSKEKQLNKIRSLCKLTIEEVMHGKKKNYIYVIDEIYNQQKEIEDKRQDNGKNKYKENFHILWEDFMNHCLQENYYLEEGFSILKNRFDYIYFGLSDARIEKIFNEVAKEFNKIDIEQETLVRWKETIVKMIKQKTYAIFATNVLNFKKLNTKVELSIVVTNDKGEPTSYIIRDEEFIKAFNDYKKEFAEKNYIKMFGKISFGGCTKEQYQQFIYEFLTDKKIREKFSEVRIGIYGSNFLFEHIGIKDIDTIKKIMIIEKPINYECILTEEEVCRANIDLRKAIRETLDNNVKAQIEKAKKERIEHFISNKYFQCVGVKQREKQIKQIERAVEKEFRYSDEMEFKLKFLYTLI